MNSRAGQFIAPIVALCLLAVLAVQAAMRPTPEDTAPYHNRVKDAHIAVWDEMRVDSKRSELHLDPTDLSNKEIKLRFGDWFGGTEPTSGSAYRLLRPNVIFTRVFTHQDTKERVTFLLVHCKDARDIYGHYPPNCYPGQGWVFDRDKDRLQYDLEFGGEKFTGTEYHFRMAQASGRECIVYNFILLPNGQIARDMSKVSDHAWDYMKRYFGASQVQVVFNEPECHLPKERREEIFEEMVTAHMPIIKAILYGAQDDEQ